MAGLWRAAEAGRWTSDVQSKRLSKRRHVLRALIGRGSCKCWQGTCQSQRPSRLSTGISSPRPGPYFFPALHLQLSTVHHSLLVPIQPMTQVTPITQRPRVLLESTQSPHSASAPPSTTFFTDPCSTARSPRGLTQRDPNPRSQSAVEPHRLCLTRHNPMCPAQPSAHHSSKLRRYSCAETINLMRLHAYGQRSRCALSRLQAHNGKQLEARASGVAHCLHSSHIHPVCCPTAPICTVAAADPTLSSRLKTCWAVWPLCALLTNKPPSSYSYLPSQRRTLLQAYTG